MAPEKPTLITHGTSTSYASRDPSATSHRRVFSTSNLKSSAIPFAGRIGGNQEFTVSGPASEEELVRKTPDAAPLVRLRDSLDWHGFLQPIIWKAAVIECWGMSMLVFSAGLFGTSITAYASPTSLAVPLVAGFYQWVNLALFIFAAGPASGGHLNPFITMATFGAGLSTLPRSVIYIGAHLVGSVVGAFFLKLGLGADDYFPSGIIAGCTIDTSVISYGQVYVLETSSYLVAVFLSFGVGLDPRQKQVFGPALAPILVGLVVAFVSFPTAFAKAGWHGASLNPARCFGLMAAKQNMHAHWVHWLSAVTACAVNSVFYYFVPPYHK